MCRSSLCPAFWCRFAICGLLAAALPRLPVAFAQSRGCVEVPVGAPMGAIAMVPLPASPHGHAVVGVPAQAERGQVCIAVVPPVADVLRGAPAPDGDLLRGGQASPPGGADLLREGPPVRCPVATCGGR